MADSTNPVPAMMTSPCIRTRRQLVRPLLLALAPVVLIMIATGIVRWTNLGIDLPTPVWLFIWSKLVIVTVVAWRFAWQWYREEAARRYGEPGAR